MGHTTDPTRAAKAGAQSAGTAARQHKENLTPPRPRQSFVKPRKQIFADFGVQVFAPLPRAVSPERELPKPSAAAEVGFCMYTLNLEYRISCEDGSCLLSESVPSVLTQSQLPSQTCTVRRLYCK